MHEFYLLTTASYRQEDVWYDSEIFATVGEELVSREDLEISSSDATIKAGKERAPLAKVANLARRFAELSLASLIPADFVILDGTLEPTWKNEEKYLSRLGNNVCALAKSCSLFTVLGNNPAILLGKNGISGCWSYFVDGKTYFVKLHPESRHVFRFEGNTEALHFLLGNSSDPLFLGYPYGLVLADQRARVSNLEKNSLRMRFLLDGQNREIVEYLRASDAHEILDSLG